MQGLIYLGYELSAPQIALLKKQQPKPNQQQIQLKKELSDAFSLVLVSTEELIGAHFVDLYLEANNKKYVIELDGPQHYDGKGQLMPKDQMRDQWLKEQGYTVLRYRHSEPIKNIAKKL